MDSVKTKNNHSHLGKAGRSMSIKVQDHAPESSALSSSSGKSTDI
jgi:hypothetical protein